MCSTIYCSLVIHWEHVGLNTPKVKNMFAYECRWRSKNTFIQLCVELELVFIKALYDVKDSSVLYDSKS